jgi:two-component system response regulator AtoC
MNKEKNNRIPILASGIDNEALAWLEKICKVIPFDPEVTEDPVIIPAAIFSGIHSGPDTVTARNRFYPGIPVIFTGPVEKAPQYADDIIPPPYTEPALIALQQRLKYLNSLSSEIGSLRNRLRHNEIYKNIIGESRMMMELFSAMDRVIDYDINVLITGESGTGKELIARAIHDGSARKNGPFVAVNCAGIAPDIADSLLFGHVKGSFTGANTDHTGFFEQADQGTIFLDEIGELQAEVQSKLLRVIEDRKVRRIGGRTEQAVNFRVISATNRELSEEISVKKFRSDLYYRLEQYVLKVPPLRKRNGDVRILARHFLREICSFYELGEMSFTEGVLEELGSRQWPGNVRELRHYVQRLALQNPESIISEIEPASNPVQQEKDSPCSDNGEIIPLEQLERREIEKAFTRYNGQIERASVALGISRATLYRKLKLYGII